jgi:glycosyltransferase involved in cell wall biosynthesis
MGVQDLVRDGENGFVVVTKERVEACGNRLARLSHEGERRAMGDSARRTAQEHAWDRVAAETIDIYERNMRCNRMKGSELREGVHT